jgi:predicted ATP-dependent endonuclease of OLD family
MKLKYVHIKKWKNLQDVKIEFNTENDDLTTLLVGQNATGKSNFLEALVRIFRWLYLGEKHEFFFHIKYECRVYDIEIIGNPDNSRKTKFYNINGVSVTDKHFHENAKTLYLPDHIFAYYSGLGNITRLEKEFDKFQRIFRDALLNNDPNKEVVNLPFLFFAKLIHSNFALISLLTSKDEKIKTFLRRTLGIEGIDSLLFTVRQRMNGKDFQLRKDSNSKFWNAGGDVAVFLEKLYQIALAPMRNNIEIRQDEFRKPTSRAAIYLYLPNIEALEALSEGYKDETEFFKYLNSMYMSDLLESVELNIQKKGIQVEDLDFKGLSEGEQQLLVVLGLLRFFRQKECLFLLDEPDTHLNPAWKYDYIQFLKEIADQSPKSQILMTTHEALVVKDLTETQIHLFIKSPDNKVLTMPAPLSPKGMTVDMILKNPVFGLNTTINSEVYDKILRQRELLVKRDVSNLIDSEAIDLQSITDELNNYGYSRDFSDPLFEDYKKAYLQQETNFDAYRKRAATVEDKAERERIAAEILQKLLQQYPNS